MHKFVILTLAVLGWSTASWTAPLQESSFWAQEVETGDLPPVAQRLPQDPLLVDLEAKGRSFGVQGGTLRTMVTRSKDIRQMVVYGYARLVGYDHTYSFAPDILRDIEIEDGRRFTMHLRKGHNAESHPHTERPEP